MRTATAARDRAAAFCARFGLRAPILQAPMAGASPAPLAAAVAIVVPHLIAGGFGLSLLCRMGIAIVFALSFNMLLGQGGMLDFGHAVFLGLGGFLATDRD